MWFQLGDEKRPAYVPLRIVDQEARTVKAGLVGERGGEIWVIFPPTNFGHTRFYAGIDELAGAGGSGEWWRSLMVMSDIEIWAEIAEKRLVFDPSIPEKSDRFGSSSVDMLLHEEMIVLPAGPVDDVIVRPRGGQEVMDFLRRNGNTKVLSTDGSHVLEAYRRVIGKTLETIILPDPCGGSNRRGGVRWPVMVWGCIFALRRSWLGIRAGCTWRCTTMGPFPIELRPGMRDCPTCVGACRTSSGAALWRGIFEPTVRRCFIGLLE